MSVEDAADLIGIGRSKAYELVRSQQFPTPVRRIGRRYLVLRSPLLSYLGDGTDRPETQWVA